ncbi:hypothetical protein [Geobacter anodireducens]|uniref:hypothetical protein n=1 Tax=Geobacter soli TaxID=1510391 RepID=UPI001929D98D|nr:hypothetical protein [Geobacter soli]
MTGDDVVGAVAGIPKNSPEKSYLQNRVDPWGKLQVMPQRGVWMGNRGILHNDEKQIVKPWQHKGWVTCRLKYGESTRTGNSSREKLFTPGNYSELFFLDEATALAAGHRPCSQCRNKRYKEFKLAWAAANRDRISSDDPPYKEMDEVLQGERALSEGEKNTYAAALDSLPEGTMIELDGKAFLVWRARLYQWSFSGYTEDKAKRAPAGLVKVLTPASIVRMYSRGFVPQVDVSAFE